MNDDTCERCEGHRWLYVTERWAEQQAPDDPLLLAAVLAARSALAPWQRTPEEAPRDLRDALKLAEDLHAHHRYRQAVARESVYPCPVCNADQFERWSGGHYHPKHNPFGCTECQANGWTPAQRKRGAA